MPQAIYFGLYAPKRAHTHTHNPQSWSVVSQVLLGKMSFYPSVSEANVADNRVSRERRQEAKTSQSSWILIPSRRIRIYMADNSQKQTTLGFTVIILRSGSRVLSSSYRSRDLMGQRFREWALWRATVFLFS